MLIKASKKLCFAALFGQNRKILPKTFKTAKSFDRCLFSSFMRSKFASARQLRPALIKTLKGGESYDNLKEVYVICFMDFTLEHESDQLVYRYVMREQDTGELYGRLLSIYFCELPRILQGAALADLNPSCSEEARGWEGLTRGTW